MNYQRLMRITECNRKIILIYFSDDLQICKIYLKSWTDWIMVHKGCYYIHKRPWELSDKSKNHPLIFFGKFFSNPKRSPHALISATFNGLFKNIWVNIGNDKIHYKTDKAIKFKMLTKCLPGYVEVVEQQEIPGGFQTSDGKSLQFFTWICSLANDTIVNQHYVELYASFQLTHLYCYCSVNVIHYNQSTTVAMIIGTTETAELYNHVYEIMEESWISYNEIKKLPVLSDLRFALMSFCEERKLTNFLCHRHFLERFGNPILRK